MLLETVDRAITEYQEIKKNSKTYTVLMLNVETGEIQVKTMNDPDFSWNTDYKFNPIVNLNQLLFEDFEDGLWSSLKITLSNVVFYIEWKFQHLAR